jgi:16S rRNA G1207 methylase RsmC
MSETEGDKVEHYFSASPAGEFRTSEVAVALAGRDFIVETSGGIFSPDHVDAGTEALLRTVDAPPLTGNLLDIGSGWGPIALTLALESPAARVFAVDVNERALELTRRNAARVGVTNVSAASPDAIDSTLTFDAIWSNPPIRVGKAELHSIMSTWLPRLNVGGQAWLVIAKHLGADSFEKWLRTEFSQTHEVARANTHKGFRILVVTRSY